MDTVGLLQTHLIIKQYISAAQLIAASIMTVTMHQQSFSLDSSAKPEHH